VSFRTSKMICIKLDLYKISHSKKMEMIKVQELEIRLVSCAKYCQILLYWRKSVSLQDKRAISCREDQTQSVVKATRVDLWAVCLVAQLLLLVGRLNRNMEDSEVRIFHV